MKFEEKLIKLRKENGLSQEELGEKLNVTRQTISKWELGETKPDSGKIMEISNLFNTSVDALLNETNDEVNTQNEEPNKKSKNNSQNIIIYIIIGILLVAIIGSAIFFFIAAKILGTGYSIYKNTQERIDSMIEDMDSFETTSSQITGNKNNNNNYKKNEHNSNFEGLVGVQSKLFVETVLNRAIQENSKGEYKVTASYKDKVYSDNSEIAGLITELKSGNNYLITCEYDDDGFINNIVIADV